MMSVFLLSQVAWIAYFTWLTSAAACRVMRSRGLDPGHLGTLRAELHPFRYALAVADFILHTAVTGPDVMTGVLLALNLLWGWLYRHDNDDDDRWKRRGRKVADRVAEVAGRLTVVPEPA